MGVSVARRWFSAVALSCASLCGVPTDSLAYSNDPDSLVGRTNRDYAVGCWRDELDGGGCHGNGANVTVSVSITGPNALNPGESATYTVTLVKGGNPNGTPVGAAIAATGGVLSAFPGEPMAVVGNGELIHTSNLGPLKGTTSGVASYQFTYTMLAGSPAGTATTLYAVAAIGFASTSHGARHAADFTVYTRPPAPDSVVATSTVSTQMDLSWSGGGPEYRVVYKPGATPPASPTDGTWVNVAGTSTTIAGLTFTTQYSFAIYSKLPGVDVFSNAAATTTQTTANVVPVARYVNAAAGSNIGDCANPAAPCRTIAYAMSQAQIGNPGDEVLVAPGTYDVALGEIFPISLKSGVRLKATGTPEQTIVDADADTVRRGIFKSTGNQSQHTRIEGFTLRKGRMFGDQLTIALGGAIEINAGDAGGILTITRNIFSLNESRGASADPSGVSPGFAAGGAIAIFSSQVDITNNAFVGNVARGGDALPGTTTVGGQALGGAIFMTGSGTVANNSFYGNTAVGGNGGGSTNGNGAMGRGGGVFAGGSIAPKIENNIFVANDANSGSGGTPAASSAAALHTLNAPTVLTNLFFVNEVNGLPSSGDNVGSGAIMLDPLFHEAPGNLRLRPSSPARNAATAASAPAIDFDGVTRPNPPAIGAFEASTPTTTTALVSSLNPALPGQTVTFTATVTGAGGPPTGTVTFLDGAGPICSGVALATGQAQCATASLSEAVHSITAQYSGAADFQASTSPVLTQVVQTQFALTVVKSGAGVGTVTSSPALIDCGPICSAEFNPGASVALTAVAGAGATFTGWTGACSGTGACNVTMNAAVVVGVTFKATPVVSLVSNANPSTQGQTVTLTATVTGTSPGPTGTVTFRDGATAICGNVALSSGVAQCATGALTAGTHSITAEYSGDGNYTADTSSPLNQGVGAAVFLLTVSRNGPGSGELTSNPAGIDCGTTCSASFSSPQGVTVLPAAAAGSAFAGWSGDCVGTGWCTVQMTQARSVTATFKFVPTITVAPSVNPSETNQPVTFTATVGGAGGAGSGVVTFRDGPTPIGSCLNVPLSGGQAQCTISTLASGTHSISVDYGGSANYVGGLSPSFSQVVQALMVLTVTKAGSGSGAVTSSPAAINCGAACTASFNIGTVVALTATPLAGSTFSGWSGACTGTGACNVTMSAAQGVTATFKGTPTVGLSATPNPSASGSPVTFTATVSGTGPTATGTVTFKDGATPICSNVGLNGEGQAQCVTSTLTVGTHSITADYSGDGNYLAASSTVLSQGVGSGTFLLTVNKSGAGVGTVGSSNAPINCGATCSASLPPGQSVTLTATPSAGSVFTGWSGACSGTGPCMVTMSANQTVTATFTLTPTVGLTSSLNPSGSGQPVTFTATVTGAGPAAIGNVAFKDGGSVIPGCSAVALNGSGVANCITSTLTAGAHAITAEYAGDSNYVAANSSILSQGVGSGTFVVTVVKAGGGSGTVTSPNGINCGTTCSGSFTTLTLTATPTAGSIFTGWTGGGCSGTGTCSPTSAATVTATFKLLPTLTISSSPNPSVPNQPVVLTVTVTSPPIATGNVTFKSDGTNIAVSCTNVALNGAAQAQCTVSNLATGNRSITVEYTGDATNYLAATSSAFTQVVQALVALNVTRAGAGTGTVTSNPAAINCGSTCSANFLSGAVVTLTATPDAGSDFGGWSGDCAGAGACVVTMSSVRNVTATFKRTPTLSIGSSLNPSAPGQAVTFTAQATGSAGVATGTFAFKDGSTVIAGCGAVALNGSGQAQCTTASLAIGMRTISADYSGNASYSAGTTPPITQVVPGPVILTVSKAGTGSGTVVSASSPLINCGPTCSASFSVGVTVTLTATPASGSTFAGWSGACSGTGDCQILMSSATSVTASFAQSSLPLTVTKSGAGAGTVSSTPAGIDCGASCIGQFNVGASVTLTATPAAGSAFAGWSGGGCSGAGSCVVSMSAATTVNAQFNSGTDVPRLANISTRMPVLTGNNVLIGGFIIEGDTAKTVVVRARGPSLLPFGLTNALLNPMLQLVRSSDQAQIAVNDNWQSAANAADIQASGFAPSEALESAIMVTLAPGAYSAIVTGAAGGTGIGIVEVFEVDQPTTPLVNISTRGAVFTGNDVMIGGFVIQGSGPQTVVVRARGPSLLPFGLTDALLNPMIQLIRSSDQAQIAVNDNWQSAANAADIQASGFAPPEALESAILITLPPGAYSVILTGAGGATGIAILEVFAL